MSANDNSVNMKSSAGRTSAYHHGDLQEAAMEAALAELRDQQHPDLGLRSLARALGVSATALYRHFPNKDALLDALAQHGITALGEHQAEAARQAEDARAAFVAVGIAYVEWALANPALFRLTFARISQADMTEAAVDGAIGEARRQLDAGVEATLPKEASAELKADAASHAWSLVHGLAHLVLDGQIAPDPQRIAAIVSLAGKLGEIARLESG